MDEFSLYATLGAILLQFVAFLWLFWDDHWTRTWTKQQILAHNFGVVLIVQEPHLERDVAAPGAGKIKRPAERLSAKLSELLEALDFVVWRIELPSGEGGRAEWAGQEEEEEEEDVFGSANWVESQEEASASAAPEAEAGLEARAGVGAQPEEQARAQAQAAPSEAGAGWRHGQGAAPANCAARGRPADELGQGERRPAARQQDESDCVEFDNETNTIRVKALRRPGELGAQVQFERAIELIERRASELEMNVFAYISVFRAASASALETMMDELGPHDGPARHSPCSRSASRSASRISNFLARFMGWPSDERRPPSEPHDSSWPQLFGSLGLLFAAFNRLVLRNATNWPPTKLLLVQDNTGSLEGCLYERFLRSFGAGLAQLLRRELACRLAERPRAARQLVQLIEVVDWQHESANQAPLDKSLWARLGARLAEAGARWLFGADEPLRVVLDQRHEAGSAGARAETTCRPAATNHAASCSPRPPNSPNIDQQSAAAAAAALKVDIISRTISDVLLLVNARDARLVIV